jgi:peptidoglycan/LPS O-acetylase OafA/YrhL
VQPTVTGGTPRQPEIQALRAFAVLAVVLNHLWPGVVPGGYVGVDVFFVISGYLITSHLLREVDRTDRISLPAFWARRARRLLPASLLVIAVSAIVTLVWAPQSVWAPFFRDFAASATYVLNWFLASDSIDYFAVQNTPSPVQHYWSLSVEEQFYLVWPLLILVAIAVAARVRRLDRLPAIAIILSAVVAASLICSIVITLTDPDPAYFLTTTRAWEFGIGGLLAVLVASGRTALSWPMPRLRAGAAWAGLLVLVASLLVFDPETSFPGWRALVPTLAAAAVIWAGSQGMARLSPDRLFRLHPVQWLGDISYSVYLWHWPMIALLPFVLQGDLTDGHRVLILLASLALGWATKTFVEDPVRMSRRLTSRRPLLTFGLTAGAMALVVGAWASTVTYIDSRVTASIDLTHQLVAAAPDCFGAAAAEVDLDGCVNPELEGVLVPDRAAGQSDRVIDPSLNCRLPSGTGGVKVCTLVEGSGARVALVGDSHAEHWIPALTELAQQRNWTLDTILKGGCPLSTVMHDDAQTRGKGTCKPWNKLVLSKLRSGDYDLVVTSQATGKTFVGKDGESSEHAAVRGMTKQWRAVEKATHAPLIVIRDSPLMPFNVPDCLSQLGDRVFDQLARCAVPEKVALLPDPQIDAAKAAGAGLIDLTKYFCQDSVCPAVIGSVIVYRDDSHLGGTYSRTLAPYLAAQLDRLVGDALR